MGTDPADHRFGNPWIDPGAPLSLCGRSGQCRGCRISQACASFLSTGNLLGDGHEFRTSRQRGDLRREWDRNRILSGHGR